MARKPGRAVRGLAGMSFSMLQMELRRRERLIRALERRRNNILAKVEQLEVQILSLGGSSGGRRGQSRPDIGRVRPRNEMNLVDALAKTLDGKTMSVTEAADAVQRAGYKSSAANFRVIVNQTLLKSPKFKKVARGQYTAK